MRALPVIALLGAAGIALAQPSSRPILHEDLPAPSGDRPTPMIGARETGRNPTAFQAGDKVLPKPAVDAGADKTRSEPVLGKGGFAADRDTSMRPDENTGPDSTLHYVSVFNPDVLPFKRMSALDDAREDFTLHVRAPALQPVPVGGTTDPKTRDRFWGDVLIDLKPGVDVPLPSVAPDMRILSYETSPKIRLAFEKDGADNFFVRSDESNASGTYRLVFLCDANAGYFAPALPPDVKYVRDVTALAPPEIRPQKLPRNVLDDGRITLQKLGIDRDTDLSVAFNTLVAWFRAFQAGEIKHPTSDVYRDLCDTQTGVCRHRAFAFMVTANVLGIPTRYVENEAHAFVEVWFPKRGWQRIDLGGAALRMDVTGANNKTLHRPRADDPFSKPKEYKQQYTQLEGEIRGLSDQQIADKRKTLDQAPSSGAIGSGAGSGEGTGGANNISPDQTKPAVPPDPKKPTPRLIVTLADSSAYRGGYLHVEGIVRVDGKPLADHTLAIYVSSDPYMQRNSIYLGRATSTADGTFRTDLQLPAGLELRTYYLSLTSDEDAYYNAARSD